MLKLVDWYPDLVAGAIYREPQPTPPDLLPQWCHFGRCRHLATHQEELCCRKEWAVFDCNVVRTTTPASPDEASAPGSGE